MAGWYLDNTHFPWSLNSYNSLYLCPAFIVHVFAIGVALGVTIFSVAVFSVASDVVVFDLESSNLLIHVNVGGVICGGNKLPRCWYSMWLSTMLCGVLLHLHAVLVTHKKKLTYIVIKSIS